MLNKLFLLPHKIFLVFLAVLVVLSCDVSQDWDIEMDTDGVEGDRTALEELYNATQGNTWEENEHWNTDMPLGNWHGVTTNPDSGRVTLLDLSGNQLSGDIPSELGNLTMLELLNLSNNRLTGQIPTELGDLNLLQALWLQNNRLEGEIPSELADTSALRQLYLSSNGLVGPLPLNLMDLSNLMTLDISGTDLCVPVALKEWLDSQMTVFQGEICEEVAASYGGVKYETTEGEVVATSLYDASAVLSVQSSPSISIELSPGHSVPLNTEIIGTITLNNLDAASYSSLIFRADLTDFDPHYTTAAASCEGEEMGEDITIEVDESQEAFTVGIYKSCPHHIYAHYTLDASISKVDTSSSDGKVELASTSTRFSVSRYLAPGEITLTPPVPGAAAWIEPDPTTFEWYVGEWVYFRPRTDVLQYLNTHVGVRAFGSEPGHFVSAGEARPNIAVEEACMNSNEFSVHWRRAINQGLWIGACRSGDAGILLQHETDAVAPLYRYEFRTLVRGENDNSLTLAPDPAPRGSAPDPAPPVSAPDPAPPVSAPDPVPPVSAPDDRVRESESSGCAIASEEVKDNTSESILLNLFLIVSVLFSRVLWKSHSRG